MSVKRKVKKTRLKNKKSSKKNTMVLVRKINKETANIIKTDEQKTNYYNAVLNLVEKIQDHQYGRNTESLHTMFLPLIKGLIKKYYIRIANARYYEYDDFVNEVNCMFLELVNEFKPKYSAAKFFVFYIKFMLERRIMGFLTDFYRNPLPEYNDVNDFNEIPYTEDLDEKIFMRFFWKKVEEEISLFPKGKKFMRKYFFDDKPCTIKELNKEFDSNMYVVYDKLKKKLKSYFKPNKEVIEDENN